MKAIYDKSISEFKENGKRITLFSLSIPLFFESIFLQLYGTFNTIILQRYSEDAVTAVSVSESIINIAVVVITMVIKGAVILISFSLGKNDRKKAADIAGTAFVTVLFVSLILGTVICLFSSELIGLMNLNGFTAINAQKYLQIRAAGIIFISAMSYFNNMLIVNGYAKSTLFIGIISNILNIMLCYIFLYTDLCFPFAGATAVAVAAIISQLVGVLIALPFFLKRCPYRFCFFIKNFIKIIILGIPSGMCNLFYALSQTITTGFVAIMGNSVVNAKVYISNIVIYTCRISMALGNATGILMGRYRGRGRLDVVNKLFRQNIILCVLGNITVSLIAFAFCKPLISLFTAKAEIITIAIPIMFIDVFIEAFRAVNHVGEFSLNANGDVKATLLISAVSTWLFGVVLSYVFGIVLNMGLVGIWIAFAVDELSRAIAYCLRWKSKQWQLIKL